MVSLTAFEVAIVHKTLRDRPAMLFFTHFIPCATGLDSQITAMTAAPGWPPCSSVALPFARNERC